jgi:hypothetical protein
MPQCFWNTTKVGIKHYQSINLITIIGCRLRIWLFPTILKFSYMYIYYEMHSAIKNILDEDVCSFKTYNFCVGERHVI